MAIHQVYILIIDMIINIIIDIIIKIITSKVILITITRNAPVQSR